MERKSKVPAEEKINAVDFFVENYKYVDLSQEVGRCASVIF